MSDPDRVLNDIESTIIRRLQLDFKDKNKDETHHISILSVVVSVIATPVLLGVPKEFAIRFPPRPSPAPRTRLALRLIHFVSDTPIIFKEIYMRSGKNACAISRVDTPPWARAQRSPLTPTSCYSRVR
ncbi:hypothetical protein EVAR_95747_1 [Eumeta japonica]|uniref:Uncharacterized protein n=1 Tax=Eumeta variegata TaxID=151549 RepID=A0A4C1UKI3_EUMVA|nr:hypothetical protein EVAR_95747_1 [Eumeta japonica]